MGNYDLLIDVITYDSASSPLSNTCTCKSGRVVIPYGPTSRLRVSGKKVQGLFGLKGSGSGCGVGGYGLRNQGLRSMVFKVHSLGFASSSLRMRV